MDLFGKAYKKGVKLSTRNDDADGLYWQKIDDIRVEGLEAGGKPRVMVHKTTVSVRREGAGGQEIGAHTTQALFPDSKFDFFERDTKKLLGAGLGLSPEERNQLEGPDRIRYTDEDGEIAYRDAKPNEKPKKGEEFVPGVGSLLIKDKVLNGSVLEFKCTRMPTAKDPEKMFTEVVPIRRVRQAELEETLTPEQVTEFFPEGLPEDVA